MRRRMRSVIAKRRAESKEENGEKANIECRTRSHTNKGTGMRPIRPLRQL